MLFKKGRWPVKALLISDEESSVSICQAPLFIPKEDKTTLICQKQRNPQKPQQKWWTTLLGQRLKPLRQPVPSLQQIYPHPPQSHHPKRHLWQTFRKTLPIPGMATPNHT